MLSYKIFHKEIKLRNFRKISSSTVSENIQQYNCRVNMSKVYNLLEKIRIFPYFKYDISEYVMTW